VLGGIDAGELIPSFTGLVSAVQTRADHAIVLQEERADFPKARTREARGHCFLLTENLTRLTLERVQADGEFLCTVSPSRCNHILYEYYIFGVSG